MQRNRPSYGLACILILAGCGPTPNDPGPGGVTVGEAQALDEAAEMLDERNAPPENYEDIPGTEQE